LPIDRSAARYRVIREIRRQPPLASLPLPSEQLLMVPAVQVLRTRTSSLVSFLVLLDAALKHVEARL
jgi:hypothetical protein